MGSMNKITVISTLNSRSFLQTEPWYSAFCSH